MKVLARLEGESNVFDAAQVSLVACLETVGGTSTLVHSELDLRVGVR